MPRVVHAPPPRRPAPLSWKKVYPDGATEVTPVLINVFRHPSGIVSTEELAQAVAERFADRVRTIISNQSYAWVPHAPAYAAYKRRNRLDPRIFIATGQYLASIQARKEDGKWIVGVPDTPIGKGGTYTLKDLARWLEFGTKHMPARPHWRPALALFKAEMHQIGNVYKKLVRELAFKV